MRMCAGRWRVALGMGAALALMGGLTAPARAGDGKPLFPWRKNSPPAPAPVQRPIDRGNAVVLPEALTLEEEAPLSSVTQADQQKQTDSQKPPASSTGTEGVPTPPPRLNKPAPLTTTPAPTTMPDASKPESLTPVPNTTMGEVLGGPISEGMPGDPYPLFYRDRPTGKKAEMAEIITHNRSAEYPWYREWRRTYYGYYPTQWRPFPEGWHLGRNIPPAPYAHPYDLKQPNPDPENTRPRSPRSSTERQREEGNREPTRPAPSTDRNLPGPPLRSTPGAGSGTSTAPGNLTPNPSATRRGIFP